MIASGQMETIEFQGLGIDGGGDSGLLQGAPPFLSEKSEFCHSHSSFSQNYVLGAVPEYGTHAAGLSLPPPDKSSHSPLSLITNDQSADRQKTRPISVLLSCSRRNFGVLIFPHP